MWKIIIVPLFVVDISNVCEIVGIDKPKNSKIGSRHLEVMNEVHVL